MTNLMQYITKTINYEQGELLPLINNLYQIYHFLHPKERTDYMESIKQLFTEEFYEMPEYLDNNLYFNFNFENLTLYEHKQLYFKLDGNFMKRMIFHVLLKENYSIDFDIFHARDYLEESNNFFDRFPSDVRPTIKYFVKDYFYNFIGIQARDKEDVFAEISLTEIKSKHPIDEEFTWIFIHAHYHEGIYYYYLFETYDAEIDDCLSPSINELTENFKNVLKPYKDNPDDVFQFYKLNYHKQYYDDSTGNVDAIFTEMQTKELIMF